MSLLRDILLLIDAPKLARAGRELLWATLFFTALAVLLTWPTALHLHEVILGGGELGGWLWRQWWHFTEIEALDQERLDFIGATAQLLGLGRYPETGNILDVLLLSYPLDRLFGFPDQHNLKVLVILIGNGIAGYALARSFTSSRLVALVAGSVAVLNPLVIQDINKTGLRQVVLWWLLLYPIFLARVARTGALLDAALAAACFVMAAAWYWFYGLFAGLFTVLWLATWAFETRPSPRRVVGWLLPFGLAVGLGTTVFLTPYLSSGAESGGQGGAARLPELTFFVPFPAYDTIAAAPLRPSSYRENVLSSLHRTIDSAWPADYVLNPRHGVGGFPIAVLFMGVIPAAFSPRGRRWLLVWLLFWLGSLGPFLKLGAMRDTAEVVRLGDYVVRLPFTWMFQFIPGMSRMFAPYRLVSVVVVASVALMAISLDAARGRLRPLLAMAAGLAVILQPFYRFDLGNVAKEARPEMWRIPTAVSAFALPSFYAKLDPRGWEGIIELPLEQQQDLFCLYQVFHRRKVYRSWATTPAIPPFLRKMGGGTEGRRLRWLASPEPGKDPAGEVLSELSRAPMEADLSQLRLPDLEKLLQAGDYRWIILHERGFYLVRPGEGAEVYRSVVDRLSAVLGIAPTEMVEQQAFDWPGKARSFPAGPAWLPWASQEVQLPIPQLPRRYFMSVFDLEGWTAGSAEGDGDPAAMREGAP